MILLLWAVYLPAQTNFFSQYNQHPFLLNPAFAGYGVQKGANLWNRNTYSRFDNLNFATLGAGYHQSLGEDQSGFGFTLGYEEELFGLIENLNVNGAYAYNFEVSDETSVRLGLGIGAGRRADSIVSNQQGGIFGTDVNYYGTLNFGLLVEAGNWQVSFSAINANQPRINTVLGERAVRQLLFGMVRYRYEVEEGIEFLPSLLLRREGFDRTASVQVDGDVRLMKKFLIGGGFRVSRLGSSVFFINGIRYNSNINYAIVRAGAEITPGVDFFLTYDTPLRNNNGVQTIVYGFLEAGFSIRFTEQD